MFRDAPCRLPGGTCLAILSVLAAPAAAQSPDRWTADEVEARATLPPPRDSAKVTGAELSCAAQKWTLRLTVARADGLADGLAGDEARIGVDGDAYPARLAVQPGALAIAVPRAALEPMKSGLRLDVDFTGAIEEAVGDLAFSLRGSRIAMTAVEERCSLRDMSPYRPVTFTPYSSYLNLARTLRRTDIDAFALATASQPTLDAAMTEFGDGRRVLFTRLCGSSWYFGASGCNITGFAPQTPGDAEGGGETVPAWRVVYDTENVVLHTDPKSAAEGWPDLVTLPVRSAGPGRIWRWEGRDYALHGDLPEEGPDEGPEEGEGEPLPLRPGRD